MSLSLFVLNSVMECNISDKYTEYSCTASTGLFQFDGERSRAMSREGFCGLD